MASLISKKKASSKQTTYAYQRVEQDIREKVRDGRLPMGSMLASRHNLAREYGVSLSTAQQAIANLIADGILEASDRRGTFVARNDGVFMDGSRHSGLIEAFSSLDGFGGGGLPSDATVRGAVGTLGIVATALIDSAVVPDVGSLWSQQAIRALERVFSAAGGTIRFFDRFPASRGPYARGIDDENAVSMAEAIRSLRADGATALAVIGLCDVRDVSDEIVSSIDVDRVPVVYVSWHGTRPPLAQVYYDNRIAGYQAAQHLLRKGYTRLLVLCPVGENWLAERISGAVDAVRHAGLPSANFHVFPESPAYENYVADLSEAWGYDAGRQLFAEGGLCGGGSDRWGIIAPNDHTAYSVLRAAREAGKIPGSDFGLIGFDDDPRSYALGLTTVRPPIEEMGEEAGHVLLRALRGERNGLQVCLRSQIIPRASTDLPVVQNSRRTR